MTTKSETSRLIDKIIAMGPAPLLKAAGYRKIARSFHAEAAGLFKVVQFQASMWNTPGSGQFTVNLIIALPYFHEKWTGQSFPKNPGSAAPVITWRIGQLMPEKRDFWWEVTPQSDVDRISMQVATALSQHGLPFLDKHATLESLTQAAKHKDAASRIMVNPTLCLAILLTFQGKALHATRVLRELAEKNTHEGFGRTISLIGRRLGLEAAS